jgi:hypothetical protein
MKIVKSLLFILAFSLISLSCSDNSSNPDDNDNTDYVSIPSKTITGKFKVMISDWSTGHLTKSLIDWNKGELMLNFLYSVTDTIAKTKINADGSFSITFPDKLSNKFFASPSFIGLNNNTNNLKMTIVPLYGWVETVEDGIKIDRQVSFYTFKDKDYSAPEVLFRLYCFSGAGDISGTNNVSGDNFNLSVQKGWNYLKWNNPNMIGKTIDYTAVNDLPNDIVFYIYR